MNTKTERLKCCKNCMHYRPVQEECGHDDIDSVLRTIIHGKGKHFSCGQVKLKKAVQKRYDTLVEYYNTAKM